MSFRSWALRGSVPKTSHSLNVTALRKIDSNRFAPSLQDSGGRPGIMRGTCHFVFPGLCSRFPGGTPKNWRPPHCVTCSGRQGRPSKPFGLGTVSQLNVHARQHKEMQGSASTAIDLPTKRTAEVVWEEFKTSSTTPILERRVV